MCKLEQAALSEAGGVLSDDDVIEDPHVDQRQSLLEAGGNPLVGLRGLADARRMVVGKNARGGVVTKSGLHHFTGVNTGAINRAPEEFLKGNHPVAVIQPEDGEDLVFQCREPKSGKPDPEISRRAVLARAGANATTRGPPGAEGKDFQGAGWTLECLSGSTGVKGADLATPQATDAQRSKDQNNETKGPVIKNSAAKLANRDISGWADQPANSKPQIYEIREGRTNQSSILSQNCRPGKKAEALFKTA